MVKFALSACLSCFLVLVSLVSSADDFPPRSNTLVTDYAGVLSDGQRNSLEQKLVGGAGAADR